MAVARSAAYVAALCLSIALAATSPARAQSAKAYRDGVKAVEKGDWAEAKRLMRTAIADRSEEKKKYTPHYYLGRSLFELGDCEGALTSWQESERQGVLGRDELEKIRDGRALCQARQDDKTRVAAELGAVRALEQADRSAAALHSALGSGADEAWRRGNPSPSARQQEVEKRLEAIRQAIASAQTGGDAPAMERGAAAAHEIAKELDDLTTQVHRLRSEQGARLGELRGKIDDLVKAGRELLRTTADLAPYPPQLKRSRADLESLLGEIEKSAEKADDDYLTGANSRLAFSLQGVKDAAARPPAALSAAADAFFAGDYAKVIESLGKFTSDSPRARAHAMLLRSAAGYYLWVEQGESDQERLAKATADAAACRRLDPKLQPPATLLSPRFVEFFAAAAAAPAQP